MVWTLVGKNNGNSKLVNTFDANAPKIWARPQKCLTKISFDAKLNITLNVVVGCIVKFCLCGITSSNYFHIQNALQSLNKCKPFTILILIHGNLIYNKGSSWVVPKRAKQIPLCLLWEQRKRGGKMPCSKDSYSWTAIRNQGCNEATFSRDNSSLSLQPF